MGRRFLSKTHVIATILVILDISCMFVTMATDSARNLVCWALGSSIVAMWCQFGPLSDFLSLCLSPPACVSLSFCLCLSSACLLVSLFSSSRKQLFLHSWVTHTETVPCSAHPKPLLSPSRQSLTKQVPEWTEKPHYMGNTGGRHSVGKGLSQALAVWNDLCCLPADGPMGRMSLGSGRHGLEECDFPCVLECNLHLSEPLFPRLLKKTQVENGRGGEDC